jgi:ADP-ribose pyrophosphatase YjhB (NUDIX family)
MRYIKQYTPIRSTRIAIEHEGHIAMAARASGEQKGMFELFGGGIESGETALIAAGREVNEEFRFPVHFVNHEPVDTHYEIKHGKRAGTEVKVACFLAAAESFDMGLSPDIHLPESGIWIPPEEIPLMNNVTPASKLAINTLGVLL